MMLTKEDLKAIGDLIDTKMDQRFAEFEERFEKKMNVMIDEKLNGLFKILSERIDRLEERIAKKFTEIDETLESLDMRLRKLEG